MQQNREGKKSVIGIIKKAFRALLIATGILFIVMLALSFTDKPFWAYYWLGTHNAQLKTEPDYIVVMGAGGVPSPESLIRCYYAAEAAKTFPLSKIVIALPTLEEYFYQSHTYGMFLEIRDRGIDSTRFIFEINGTNTRTQALEVANTISNIDESALLIITSPEHVYRSVLAFRKVGFKKVGGIPTFESAFNKDLLLDEDERKQKLISPNRDVTFRYNMWNYLVYEILVIREFFAITYYKLKGWI